MALVKLRPVAGDMALGSQLIRARDGFVYSGKPIDYEDILHLRERQARELVPSGSISAKHSPGGLVDVEYFVQARQIEAGRLEPSVRVTNTMEAIGRLTGAGYLRAELAEELRRTYGLLRRLIDALRVVRGHAKDLTIPPAPSREFAYLARRLNYDSATQLEQEITSRMGFSRDLWNKLRQET
jgi:glutamate-ammonia-ligase adenylyltransferase